MRVSAGRSKGRSAVRQGTVCDYGRHGHVGNHFVGLVVVLNNHAPPVAPWLRHSIHTYQSRDRGGDRGRVGGPHTANTLRLQKGLAS